MAPCEAIQAYGQCRRQLWARQRHEDQPHHEGRGGLLPRIVRQRAGRSEGTVSPAGLQGCSEAGNVAATAARVFVRVVPSVLFFSIASRGAGEVVEEDGCRTGKSLCRGLQDWIR